MRNNITDQRGAPGNTQFRTAGLLMLSNGTLAPNAKIDSWTGGSANSWGDSPPGGGTFATPGDAKLWALGSRSYNPGTGQTLQLSGLSASFPNGFNVITYQDYHAGNIPGGETRVTDINGLHTASWSISNTSPFNNNFGAFGHTASVSILPGVDTVSILFQPTSGAAFAQATLLGVQIVGEVADPVPEPNTYALGLIGLAGLGVVVWRRRRQS